MREKISGALWTLFLIAYVVYLLIGAIWSSQNSVCVDLFRKKQPEKSYAAFLQQRRRCGQFLGIFDAKSLKRSLESAAKLATKEKKDEWAAKFYDLCLELNQSERVELRDSNLVDYARAFAKIGESEKGIELLKTRLQKDTDNLRLMCGLAEVYSDAKKHRKAISQICSALVLANVLRDTAEQKKFRRHSARENLMWTSESAGEIYEAASDNEQAEFFRKQACELAQKMEDWDAAIINQEELVAFYERIEEPSKALDAQKLISTLEAAQRAQEK